MTIARTDHQSPTPPLPSATRRGGAATAPWRVVRQARLGRLHLGTGRGPRGLVVGLRSTDDRVFLHVPEFNDAAGYLDGTDVDLEVTGPGPTGALWEVHVLGPAAVVRDADVPPAVLADAESWPSGVRSRFVAISPRSVRSVVQPTAA